MAEAAASAKAAMARGDYIAAYDAAISAIDGGDASNDIRHQHVLALARMGDIEGARALFEQYDLEHSANPHHRAVGPRLLKDGALAMPAGEARRAALDAACAAYRAIHDASGDYYTGINAASLALLTGREGEAEALAEKILSMPEIADPKDYYAGATAAEALLLLGRVEEAGAMLRGIAPLADDQSARSTTCRQLALLARHIGVDADAAEALLAPIRPPTVIHYCGHMFAADSEVEAALSARIAAALEERGVGFAYGSLASGADILIAETLLARGAELHLILPFVEEDFIAQSVAPAGESWLPRYRACVAAATSRVFSSEMQYVGDPGQFAYSSRVAMGLARLRAQRLGNRPIQLAVWDGAASTGPAGTGADVAAWRGQGGDGIVIDPGAIDRGYTRPRPHAAGVHARQLAAILFTDFVGFSKLSEAALPYFWDGVMRTVADTLDRGTSEVLTRNSWGDALYAVVPNAADAAELALELQRALAEVDYSKLGLTMTGGHMRIGAHYGPAYRAMDPITNRTTFYGTEVSRTARIEPVTPPGAVFVTQPFAAILALEAPDRFTCHYVGQIALAKDFGTYPMYRLARR